MFNSFRPAQSLALLLILFAWFVGLYNLGDMRLGADELKTIGVVKDQAPLAALTNYYSYNHIPYAFLLTLVYQFTSKLFMLRLVGVIFGLLAVAMTYRLVRTLTRGAWTLLPGDKFPLPNWLALSTTLLLVVTPMFARYYREMRGYSITVFLGLLMLFSLWQLVQGQGKQRGYWVSFVLAAVGCVYTHFFTIFALVAAALLVLGESVVKYHRTASNWKTVGFRPGGDPFLRAFALSLFVIGLLLAGLLGPLAPQILAVPNKEELSAPEFGPFALTWPFAQGLLDIAGAFSPLGDERPAAYSFFALVLLGSVWGLNHRAWRRSTFWLLTWTITPFAVNLITLNFVPAAQIRYYLLTLPTYLLLGLFGLVALIEGTMSLSKRWQHRPTPKFFRAGFALTLLIIIITAGGQLIGNLYHLGVDQAWTSVAAYLRTGVRPGDLVLCEVFELTGSDEGKCRWHLNEFAPLTPTQSAPYFSEIANYRGAEKLSPILQKPGQVWFVLYFRQPPSDKTPTFVSTPGFTATPIGRTWVIRVEAGPTLLQNLIACGEWLLDHLADEDHQFRYRLDLAQLYALAGDQETANHHLKQAFQLQQQANDSTWLPELRTVAALVRFYAPAGPSPEHPLAVNFDNRLQLAGYSLEPATLASGQPTPAHLSLYWQVLAPLEGDYSVFVHLTNTKGQVVSQMDFQPFDAIYPTSYWPVGAELREARQFTLPGDLPPGEYTLLIGLYLPKELSRLRILNDASGQNAVSLGRLLIEDQ